MKKLFILVIAVLMLAGCGPSAKTLKAVPKQEKAFADAFTPVSANPAGDDMAYLLFLNSLGEEEVMTPTPETPLPEMDEDEAMSKFLGIKTDWPKDRLHPDMPPYSFGKMNGWNQWSDNEYDIFMLIKETSQEDLDAYIKELEAAGFTENNRSYCKDLFSIKFQFNTSTILQISSYKETVEDWPEWLDFLPPIGKGDLTSINAPTDDMPYGDLYFINLTKEEIDAWFDTLKSAGFDVEDNYLMVKNVKYDGKKYDEFNAFFESNGDNEYILYLEFRNDE